MTVEQSSWVAKNCLLTIKLFLGHMMKQKTKTTDDKINNNSRFSSEENKTCSYDNKIKTLTKDDYGNTEAAGTGSDTGTYTVENEEDGDDLKVEGKGDASHSDGGIEIIGLDSKKVDTLSSEWVSDWASKTTSMEVRGGSGIVPNSHNLRNSPTVESLHYCN